MTVTIHFLDANCILQSTMLAFKLIPYPHGGIRIARCLESTLADFDLLHKVIGIVTDNASNNKTAMEAIISSRRLERVTIQSNMRCLAHIINLVVQASLKIDRGYYEHTKIDEFRA